MAPEIFPVQSESGKLPGAGLGWESGSLALQIFHLVTRGSSASQQLSKRELDIILTYRGGNGASGRRKVPGICGKRPGDAGFLPGQALAALFFP